MHNMARFLPRAFPLQGSEMKRVKPGPGDEDGEEDLDLWGETNGWGHDSDGEEDVAPLPTRNGADVSMETWIIMELCNRGSLRVGTYRKSDTVA